MHATKQKIIQSAIALFNEKGLTNVRLQHIADRAGISVGNLAYHYPSKRAIVQAVDRELEQVVTPILSFKQGFPYLIDFDNQLSRYYYLMKTYAFYFLDLLELERAYSKLHNKRKQYIAQMITQIGNWIYMNVEKGVLKKEIQDNQYNQTAHAIWIIISFWLTQQQVRGAANEDESAFKELVWNQFVPLFTTQGLMEYKALILPQLSFDSTH